MKSTKIFLTCVLLLFSVRASSAAAPTEKKLGITCGPPISYALLASVFYRTFCHDYREGVLNFTPESQVEGLWEVVITLNQKISPWESDSRQMNFLGYEVIIMVSVDGSFFSTPVIMPIPASAPVQEAIKKAKEMAATLSKEILKESEARRNLRKNPPCPSKIFGHNVLCAFAPPILRDGGAVLL